MRRMPYPLGAVGSDRRTCVARPLYMHLELLKGKYRATPMAACNALAQGRRVQFAGAAANCICVSCHRQRWLDVSVIIHALAAAHDMWRTENRPSPPSALQLVKTPVARCNNQRSAHIALRWRERPGLMAMLSESRATSPRAIWSPMGNGAHCPFGLPDFKSSFLARKRLRALRLRELRNPAQHRRSCSGTAYTTIAVTAEYGAGMNRPLQKLCSITLGSRSSIARSRLHSAWPNCWLLSHYKCFPPSTPLCAP
ncbi:hypothetical protein QBC34DRAFT_143628 [Podospora aff. communis PSN243]|uniref:Uncharacterized protein n=1 Tax=Podospora aff. communis PSN243 TaxID=3040156 RepID=A0AAV9GJF5_9PEZI|nr:hypothetical protein QBC34DRAFT_143628 [Podospora aff. communis PSN243]